MIEFKPNFFVSFKNSTTFKASFIGSPAVKMQPLSRMSINV